MHTTRVWEAVKNVHVCMCVSDRGSVVHLWTRLSHQRTHNTMLDMCTSCGNCGYHTSGFTQTRCNIQPLSGRPGGFSKNGAHVQVLHIETRRLPQVPKSQH